MTDRELLKLALKSLEAVVMEGVCTSSRFVHHAITEIEKVLEPEKSSAAIATLEQLGYTYKGGSRWKLSPQEPEVVFVDQLGASRSTPSGCVDGIDHVYVGERVYWPLSDADQKLMISAACGKGEFYGPSKHSKPWVGLTDDDIDEILKKNKHMRLGELITYLEAKDGSAVVFKGFGAPHSYRGHYEQIAFDPVEKTTVGEMLAHAKKALGSTFTGWKGGEFKMDEKSFVNIALEGDYAQFDEITAERLDCICGEGGRVEYDDYYNIVAAVEAKLKEKNA